MPALPTFPKPDRVKALYNLWVTQAEKDAMIRVLQAC
jgi:hypothetical protein